VAKSLLSTLIELAVIFAFPSNSFENECLTMILNSEFALLALYKYPVC